MIIFEIKDITGRKIHLTKEKWRHIVQRHPALSNQTESIKEAIINPLVIIDSGLYKNLKYYYRYDKNIRLKEKYLLILIKYLNGKGFIITSYYTERIKSK